MLEQFFSFNLQGIVQTLSLIGAMALVFGAMRERLNMLDKKVDKLEGVMVQLARQDERLAAMDQRMLAQGKRLDRMEYYGRRQTPKEPIEEEDNRVY